MATKTEPKIDRDAVRRAVATKFLADRLAACAYHANGELPGDDEIFAVALAAVRSYDPKAGEADAVRLLASLP